MQFVSVTRLRIRALRFLPAFGLHTRRSLVQARQAPGFRGGGLLADRRWTFWTMTGWDTEADMRAYMLSGDHRSSMPHLLAWCDEASVVHWSQVAGALPSWSEADHRMRRDGRPSKLRHPSAQHATLAYRAPRLTFTGPIAPQRA